MNCQDQWDRSSLVHYPRLCNWPNGPAISLTGSSSSTPIQNGDFWLNSTGPANRIVPRETQLLFKEVTSHLAPIGKRWRSSWSNPDWCWLSLLTSSSELDDSTRACSENRPSLLRSLKARTVSESERATKNTLSWALAGRKCWMDWYTFDWAFLWGWVVWMNHGQWMMITSSIGVLFGTDFKLFDLTHIIILSCFASWNRVSINHLIKQKQKDSRWGHKLGGYIDFLGILDCGCDWILHQWLNPLECHNLTRYVCRYPSWLSWWDRIDQVVDWEPIFDSEPEFQW